MKHKKIKFDKMIEHNATDKQIKYIEDLCNNHGFEFYNKNINMKHASSIIGFLANDSHEPHYLFDYIKYVD